MYSLDYLLEVTLLITGLSLSVFNGGFYDLVCPWAHVLRSGSSAPAGLESRPQAHHSERSQYREYLGQEMHAKLNP